MSKRRAENQPIKLGGEQGIILLFFYKKIVVPLPLSFNIIK